MLFIHPMWDTETQRIGMKECTPLGYAIRGWGELIGFLGLLGLLATLGYLAYSAFDDSFSTSKLRLLLLPFGIGIVSEAMVQTGWFMASKRGYTFDPDADEVRWTEKGQTRTYTYATDESPS